MKKWRVAVVGVGKLGRFHAEKWITLAQANSQLEWVGVYDAQEASSLEFLEKYKIGKIFKSLEEVAASVEAVTIATPSGTHFEITQFFLEKGIHCLVEKPLALGYEEGLKLVTKAKKHSCLLAVGHSERFNPGFQYLKTHWSGDVIGAELIRHSPYAQRVTDVSVIDDLMIHDLDLVSQLCGEGFKVFHKNLMSIRSSKIDGAQVSLKSLVNDSMVTLSALRVAPSLVRTLKVWGQSQSVFLNFQTNELEWCRWDKNEKEAFEVEKETFEKLDHLRLETEEFLLSLQGESKPKTLALGDQVLASLRWRDQIIS